MSDRTDGYHGRHSSDWTDGYHNTRVTGLTKTLGKNSAGLWAETFTWDFLVTSQSGNSDELKAKSGDGNRNTTVLTTA